MIDRDRTSSEDPDLTRLLNRLAPPPQDPLFRVRVMERKQRQWFRRQVIQMVGTLAVGVFAAAVGASFGDGTNEVARIVGLAVALGAGVAVYAVALRNVVRRF